MHASTGRCTSNQKNLESITSVLIHRAVQASHEKFIHIFSYTVMSHGASRITERKNRDSGREQKEKGEEKRHKGTRETGRDKKERESWHRHFRSARQHTLCHHDNSETSYPAGKQGCPGRRGQGKVVMGEKEQVRQGDGRIETDDKLDFEHVFMRTERERQK